ncbi:TRAP transporter substrate-binding protein [Rhodoferax sp.]|uniref:TRAP transporter substrate-binding protein n=1 Tax=Rhodoferax sp. TaxID=50421 RepID=UPI0025E9AD34|nr:TRAP transporter substrate-binding protein [Rhodoferax sp.]
MNLRPCFRRALAFAFAGLAFLACATAQTVPAAAPMAKLRVVGGLAALNQYVRHEEPFWTRELTRLTGGKYSAEIAPFDQSGVPGEEMLRLMSLGVTPLGTALMSQSAAQYPGLGALDLAGLNPNISTLKKHLDAFRPYMQKMLRAQHGVELLAVYTYPAQVLYCKRPFRGLQELKGRRVRVSSTSQADLMGALGAVPVLVGFSQLMLNMQSGNTECAITGTMSGNTIGLHEVTSHIHTLPITWGLALFGANVGAWNALPGDLRAVLSRELPKLEAAIWAESERETAEGLACNRGDASCKTGRPGQMKEVTASAADTQLVNDILRNTVLPRWKQRCHQQCQSVWDHTIGPLHEASAPPPAR